MTAVKLCKLIDKFSCPFRIDKPVSVIFMRMKVAYIFNVYVCLCDNVSSVFLYKVNYLSSLYEFFKMYLISSLDHSDRVEKKV